MTEGNDKPVFLTKGFAVAQSEKALFLEFMNIMRGYKEIRYIPMNVIGLYQFFFFVE